MQAHFSIDHPAVKFLEPSSDTAGMDPAKRGNNELENPQVYLIWSFQSFCTLCCQFPCFEIVFLITVIPLKNIDLESDATVMGQYILLLPQFGNFDDEVLSWVQL